LRQRWAFQRWRGARLVHPYRPWRATGKGFRLRGAGTMRRTRMAQPCKSPARAGRGCQGAVPPWVCCCTVARSSPARMAPRARAWAVRGYRAGRTFMFASPAWAPARAWRLPDSGSDLGFGGWGAPRPCARGWVRQRQRRLAWRPLRRAPAAGAGTLLGFTDLASPHDFCMRSEADAKRAVNLK